jgi:hypothetical protein
MPQNYLESGEVMKGMLKWPLIIAAILVVARVLLERADVPGAVTNLLSVVVLYVLVAPLYFAARIAGSDIDHPYRALFKKTALFTALARAMVIPTYWLAYIYQWKEFRFSVAGGGNVGAGVSPFMGYVGIPLGAAIAWIIISMIVGGGLGSIVIKVKRKSAKKVPVTAAAE